MSTLTNRQTNDTVVHLNNSLVIVEDNYLLVYCASGSMEEDIGQLIGLDGNNITFRMGDDFDTDTPYPGLLLIDIDTAIADQGVYTCRIPDENGVMVDVNIGIYPPGFNSEFYCNGQAIWVKADGCVGVL